MFDGVLGLDDYFIFASRISLFYRRGKSGKNIRIRIVFHKLYINKLSYPLLLNM